MVEIKHTHISRITDDGYCESLSKSQFVKKDDGFKTIIQIKIKIWNILLNSGVKHRSVSLLRIFYYYF